jgi:hypothetical protein
MRKRRPHSVMHDLPILLLLLAWIGFLVTWFDLI